MNGDHSLLWLADRTAAAAFFAAGALTWRWSRRTSALLLAGGLAWVAPALVPAFVFWQRAVLTHVLLAYPGWRPLSRLAGWVVGATYVLCVLFPVALLDNGVQLVMAAALVTSAWWNDRAATGTARHCRRVALLASVGLGVTVIASSVARIALERDLTEPLLIAYDLAVVAVALSLAAGLRPPAPVALSDLVIDLGGTSAGTLRDALAKALRDPELQIGYWDQAVRGYLDGDGRAVEAHTESRGRSGLAVDLDDDRWALLVLDAPLAQDRQVVSSIESAARLSAVNAQRHSAVLSQVRELEASRRRLLAAGDDERGRLETQLHAGMLPCLVDLTAKVDGLAERSATTHLDRAVGHLGRTVEDLTDLAAGLRPRELERGLMAALARLVEGSPVPVELHGSADRVPYHVELTVYYVCSEALSNTAKYAMGTRASITLEPCGDRLRVTVRDDGRGGAGVGERSGGLAGLRDRVEALGGTFSVDSESSGTAVVAELPVDDGVPR
jgi:signal transduction histidine kinase